MKKILLALSLMAAGGPAAAEAPEIVKVVAKASGMGWNFDVTVKHPDTGWGHYTDGWEIVSADGKVLAYRKLHHPHVDEQPFTRALNNVMLPDGTREVFVRAHCSKHGFDKSTYKVKLSR